MDVHTNGFAHNIEDDKMIYDNLDEWLNDEDKIVSGRYVDTSKLLIEYLSCCTGA
jgi:hypothetical protein